MSTLLPGRTWFTERDASRFRCPENFESDLLQRLAGDFYAAGAPGEVREVAGKLGMGATSWWRRTSGTEPTPLSRCGEEGLRFARAGYAVGWMGAYVETVALLPLFDRMTVSQANELLLAAHRAEEEANAALNRHQFLHLAVGAPDFYGMAVAAVQQKDRSAGIARLALRLHLLQRRAA